MRAAAMPFFLYMRRLAPSLFFDFIIEKFHIESAAFKKLSWLEDNRQESMAVKMVKRVGR